MFFKCFQTENYSIDLWRAVWSMEVAIAVNLIEFTYDPAWPKEQTCRVVIRDTDSFLNHKTICERPVSEVEWAVYGLILQNERDNIHQFLVENHHLDALERARLLKPESRAFSRCLKESPKFHSFFTESEIRKPE